MSTKRNIFFNGIANLLSKTVRIAEQLVLVPFFLSSWGAGYYGEWLTLSIFPSILAFSDLGFGSAAASAFVLAYSGGEYKKAADIYKTGLYIISGTVVLGIVLSLVIMLFAFFTGLLSKSLIEPTDAILALVFMMASKLVHFFSQLYEAFFRAKLRAATATNISTVGGLLGIVVGIIVLFLGYGVVAFALANFIVSAISTAVFCFWGFSIIDNISTASFDKEQAKKICSKGFGFMASPIWQAIYFQGSTFVVRVVIGAEGVAIFNTVRTVCRSVNQIYSIVNASIFPELQYAIGSKQIDKAKKIFVRSIQIVFLLAIIGILFLCIIGQPLYAWWTHNQLTVPNEMWYIFMTGIAFNAIWWTAGTIFRAINQPYRFAVYGLCSACISTLISYILSFYYGLTGAAIGYVALDVIMAVCVLPYALSLLNLSIKNIINYGD